MSNEPTTTYAIIYEIDGAKLFGELCKTPECAVNSINPLDGSTVLGMATLDRVPGSALAYWKRNKAAPSVAPEPQEIPPLAIPEGAWLVADITPDPSGADETGSTTGLALYIEQPNDGGPNIRQGRYEHPLRIFIESTTALPIYPDLWSSPGDIAAELKAEG